MTIRCLICICTSSGSDYVEVTANDLHQVALLMPGTVLSYEVQEICELAQPRTVSDSDLFSELDITAPDVSFPSAKNIHNAK